jgi:AraC family transcriptional regulator
MATARILDCGAVKVVDYHCDAGPGDVPYPEAHQAYTLSYVRRGGFAYAARGRTFELVAGSFMIGHPGDEYICSHDHHLCGDECLSFHLTPEAASEVGAEAHVWRTGGLAPRPELAVWAERAQAVVDGRADGSLEEIGLLIAARLAALVDGKPAPARLKRVTHADRRRAVRAALRINDEAERELSLAELSREAGLSKFHFLRVFSAALGVTPHQYLLRTRLRRAARLLADRDIPVTTVAGESGFADLSNFVRTFHRAAGISPGKFRSLGACRPAPWRSRSNFLQDDPAH